MTTNRQRNSSGKMLQPQHIPLPALKTSGALAVPSSPQLTDFVRDFNKLQKLNHRLYPPATFWWGGDLYRNPPSPPPTAEQKQELERGKQALRARWQPLDRPACDEEIVAQVAMLISAYANLGSIDVDLFSATMGGDIMAMRPTLFQLAEACRRVRGDYQFLTIAAVMKELQQLRKVSKQVRSLVKEDKQ
jgi:hypothetical protein